MGMGMGIVSSLLSPTGAAAPPASGDAAEGGDHPTSQAPPTAGRAAGGPVASSIASLFSGAAIKSALSGTAAASTTLAGLTSPFSLGRGRGLPAAGARGGDAPARAVTPPPQPDDDPLLTEDACAAAAAALASSLVPPAMLDLLQGYADAPVPPPAGCITVPLPRRAVLSSLIGTATLVVRSPSAPADDAASDSDLSDHDSTATARSSPAAAVLRFARDAAATISPTPASPAALSGMAPSGADGSAATPHGVAAVLAAIEADVRQAALARSPSASAEDGKLDAGAERLVRSVVAPAVAPMGDAADVGRPKAGSGGGGGKDGDEDGDGSAPLPAAWQVGCDLDHPETCAALARWAAPLLLSILPIDSVLLLVGAALTEQKVVFVGGALSQEVVSSCVLALAAMLRPLSWVGPLLPTVPEHLNDLLHAPIPVLLGVPSLPPDFVQDESTVIVLLDRETVRIPATRAAAHPHDDDDAGDADGEQGGEVQLLPNFLALQVPDASILYSRLEPLCKPLRLGSGSGSGAAITRHRLRPCYKPTTAQVTAAAAVVEAINAHVRRLLHRVVAAGMVASGSVEAGGEDVGSAPGAASGASPVPGPSDDWNAAAVKRLPPFQACVAGWLAIAPEAEAPFWTQLLSTQVRMSEVVPRVGSPDRCVGQVQRCCADATPPSPPRARADGFLLLRHARQPAAGRGAAETAAHRPPCCRQRRRLLHDADPR
jgi:hypothetical protein